MYGDPPPNAQTQQNITVVLADLAGGKPKVIEARSDGSKLPLIEQK